MSYIDDDFAEHLFQAAQELEFKEPERFFVCVVEEMRCYGGPEEGGWWYSRHRMLTYKRADSEAHAEAIKQKLEELCKQRYDEEAASRAASYNQLGDDDTVSCNYPEGYIPRGWSEGSKYKVIITSEPRYWDNWDEPSPHYE